METVIQAHWRIERPDLMGNQLALHLPTVQLPKGNLLGALKCPQSIPPPFLFLCFYFSKTGFQPGVCLVICIEIYLEICLEIYLEFCLEIVRSSSLRPMYQIPSPVNTFGKHRFDSANSPSHYRKTHEFRIFNVYFRSSTLDVFNNIQWIISTALDELNGNFN